MQMNENQTFNILVSSSASKIPLIHSVQSAIKKITINGGVIAGDNSPHALSARIADQFWLMPPTDDVYVESLLEGCLQRDIRMILPTRDGELLFWARHAQLLAQSGIAVVVSAEAAVNRCFDKFAFSEFGKDNELPFILSYPAPSRDIAENWVVKERFGAGSRSIGLNLSLSDAILHAQHLEAPIYQPYIQGSEISIDAWMDQYSRVKGLVLRYRELVVNGESQVTTIFKDAAIEAQAEAILGKLQLSGHAVMQAIIDDKHQLNIIECNPRFGGASTAAIAVGLDSMYWSILQTLGRDISLYPFVRLPDITQIRIPYDIYSPA
jgi:carbamoyl-phosphate synthase large subunit